jgi:hypothetical protein
LIIYKFKKQNLRFCFLRLFTKIEKIFNFFYPVKQISFSQEKKIFINKKKYWCISISYLPNTLKDLKLPRNFNQPINNLNSIINLKFDFEAIFNKPIKIPNSITHLEFESNFNQPINNLSNSITHLKFQSNFNQPINYLPNSLIHLSLRYNFNQPIDNLQI